jgi:hypothetical protein
MANLNSSGPLGNVMTRLSGLKNVRPRRVMPGAEFLEQLDDTQPDVSGASQPLPNFANFQKTNENLPEQDLGGEITPQSYDVRANTVNNSQSQQEPGFFSRLGQALADYVNPQKREEMAASNAALFNKNKPPAPPVATEQVDVQEGLPPVTAAQQEAIPQAAPETSPGILGALKDYLSPTKNREMTQYNTDLNQKTQILSSGRNPEQVIQQKQQQLGQDVQKAIENPWQYAAYGSAEQVSNSPALQAEFKNITGIDYEPQIAQQVSQHEEAMKGVEDALSGLNTQLSAEAEQIRQRILNNQSTDADKYYIGLALLMPLLIGGIFGKEAGLGALGGGAQGIADVLSGRQKGIREDEESLLNIGKQQGSNLEKLASIGLEKAKLGPALRKALPDQPEAHLQGMRDIEWVDPDTGKTERGIEIKPGMIARPQFVASKEGLNDIRKAANELTVVKNFVKEVDDLTEDIASIVTQLNDPTNVWKGFTSIIKDKVPGALSALTQDVMFDGRKQNAGTLLEEKLGFLANAYGMAKELGQLDRAAQQHIKKIIENPTSTLLTPRDALNQVLEVRNLAQKGLVENASNNGFYPEFIIKDLESRNNELFGGLNKQEQDKRLAMRKQQAMQGETNYAQ